MSNTHEPINEPSLICPIFVDGLSGIITMGAVTHLIFTVRQRCEWLTVGTERIVRRASSYRPASCKRSGVRSWPVGLSYSVPRMRVERLCHSIDAAPPRTE